MARKTHWGRSLGGKRVHEHLLVIVGCCYRARRYNALARRKRNCINRGVRYSFARAKVLHLRVSSPSHWSQGRDQAPRLPRYAEGPYLKADSGAKCAVYDRLAAFESISCQASHAVIGPQSLQLRLIALFSEEEKGSLKSRAASRPLPGCGLVLRCLKFEGRISCKTKVSQPCCTVLLVQQRVF